MLKILLLLLLIPIIPAYAHHIYDQDPFITMVKMPNNVVEGDELSIQIQLVDSMYSPISYGNVSINYESERGVIEMNGTTNKHGFISFHVLVDQPLFKKHDNYNVEITSEWDGMINKNNLDFWTICTNNCY